MNGLHPVGAMADELLAGVRRLGVILFRCIYSHPCAAIRGEAVALMYSRVWF